MTAAWIWQERAIESYVLWPLGALYAAGWRGYQALYDLGLKQPLEPHRPVVCVGNLRVGGSGKTPFTIWLTQTLIAMGREVVVSTSGYGGPRAEAAQFAPDGPLSAREWGDEPALLRDALPATPLIVGRRRVLAAQLCAERHPNAVLVLDDGFQHLPLRKHLSLILDPTVPLNPFCLPAGPYREPRKRGRARADLLLAPDSKPFSLAIGSTFLRTLDGAPIESRGQRADVVCALGDPLRLLYALEAIGLQAGTVRVLPDHDRLDAGNLLQGIGDGTPVVVTAKDWTKLRERPDLGSRTFWIADYRIQIHEQAAFTAWLRDRLDEIATQAT